MRKLQIPWRAVSWKNSIFLISTLLLTLTVTPIFFWNNGLTSFQVVLFGLFFTATGLSITLGYHRLFAHLSFQARWPVKLFTLLFGAAAFENSALDWASEHRRHHKNVDHEDDPYDINKGFFYAHIGWILFKLKPPSPMDNVGDLQRDPWVVWQHRYYLLIALLVSFGLPTAVGWAWGDENEALGSFLLAGVTRVVLVQHLTFFINSLCHTMGQQPYSSRCSARDSGIMALLTFGEGYHNYHHAFQHDYRNGVKAWQFDPTKWMIWLLHMVGLTSHLRRVPVERILQAEIAELERHLQEKIALNHAELPASALTLLQRAQARLNEASAAWQQHKEEYARVLEKKVQVSRKRFMVLRRNFKKAVMDVRNAIKECKHVQRLMPKQIVNGTT